MCESDRRAPTPPARTDGSVPAGRPAGVFRLVVGNERERERDRHHLDTRDIVSNQAAVSRPGARVGPRVWVTRAVTGALARPVERHTHQRLDI